LASDGDPTIFHGYTRGDLANRIDLDFDLATGRCLERCSKLLFDGGRTLVDDSLNINVFTLSGKQLCDRGRVTRIVRFGKGARVLPDGLLCRSGG
jgi:hypothetical protein